MKQYFKFLLTIAAILTFLFLLFSNTSCSKIITPASIEITNHDSIKSDSVSYTERLHKTIVDVQADSSSFSVTFGCDSLKNAFIKQIADLKSKGVITSYSFKDNTLYFTTKREALQQAIYTLEKEIASIKSSRVIYYKYIQKPPIIVFQSSKFNVFCKYWFFASLASIVGFAVIKLKLYKLAV